MARTRRTVRPVCWTCDGVRLAVAAAALGFAFRRMRGRLRELDTEDRGALAEGSAAQGEGFVPPRVLARSVISPGDVALAGIGTVVAYNVIADAIFCRFCREDGGRCVIACYWTFCHLECHYPPLWGWSLLRSN